MSTTAEGVETDDELSRLRFMRCTEAQGKVIGMPMSAQKFARLFDRYERTFQIA
jgi:EAL domain-containing protein (putative c-di-GMP-specific phosphodiesterase class I)